MIRSICWLVVLTMAVAACGDTSANDATTSTDAPIGGPYPVANLSIVVEHPDRDSVEYRLSCLGDTATITGDVDIDEQAACLALASPEVVTRLVEGPPADQICTEQYGGPDVATVTGTIDDQPVDTTVDRTNGCGISDWDGLLADLLIPAVGVTGEDVFGWLRSFETRDGTTIVQVDPAEMLTGDEAVAAARQDGVISGDEDLPNDFYIRNPDESTTEFTVSPDVVVTLQACYEGGDCVTTEQVDLATWSVLLGGEDDPGLDWGWYGQGSLPYTFTVAGDLIVEVAEVYLP